MVALTEQIVRGKTRVEKLEDVKNLNLWGQDLDDVSVLSRMPNVEVLSLSVNRIASLKDFRHCQKLQELYLRKNYIQDVMDLQFLQPLTNLKTLWLCDNPCADHPFYRQLVARMLPSVDKLDNMELTAPEKEAALRNPDLARYLAASGGSPDRRPSPSPPAGAPRSQPSTPPVPAPYASSRPASQQPQQPGGYANGGLGPPGDSRSGSASQGGAEGRRRKNVLYAVMALVAELEADDLVYVSREIEQRLGALGR